MGGRYFSNQMKPRTCLICGSSLGLFAPPTAELCSRGDCLWRHRSLPAHRRCAVCRRPLSQDRMAEQLCAAPECRHAQLAAREATIRQRTEAGLQRIRIRLDRAGTLLAAARIRTIVTPVFAGGTAVRSGKRLRALRTHLESLLVDATPPAMDATAQPSTPKQLDDFQDRAVAAACRSCRGHCCQHGGDHAYLTTATLRRAGPVDRGHSAEPLIQSYLSRVPVVGYRHSCIFHSSNSCTLPREMRSDTCNNFFCAGLTQFMAAPPPAAGIPILFVSAHQGGLRAATLVTESAIHRLRPAPKGPVHPQQPSPATDRRQTRPPPPATSSPA